MAGPSRRELTPADHPSSPIPYIDTDDWCETYGLLPPIPEKLSKLGFQVGDTLGDVPDKVWEEAGFTFLERCRVEKADRRHRAGLKK